MAWPISGGFSPPMRGVTLDVAGGPPRFGYAALGAVRQVEFGHHKTEIGATGDGY